MDDLLSRTQAYRIHTLHRILAHALSTYELDSTRGWPLILLQKRGPVSSIALVFVPLPDLQVPAAVSPPQCHIASFPPIARIHMFSTSRRTDNRIGTHNNMLYGYTQMIIQWSFGTVGMFASLGIGQDL